MVGRGFAAAGRGHHKAAVQPRALLAHGGGLPLRGIDGHAERGKLRDDGRARERVICRRGYRRAGVAGDLRRDLQTGQRLALKQQACAAGDGVQIADLHLAHRVVLRDREVLVARAAHRHDAEQVAAVDRGGAVIHLAVPGDRQADERQHTHVDGGGDDLAQRGSRPLQQRVLVKQVAAGRTGQAQRREHQQLHAEFVALAHGFDDFLSVILRVCNLDFGRSGRNFHKSVLHVPFTLFSNFQWLFRSVQIQTGIRRNTGAPRRGCWPDAALPS